MPVVNIGSVTTSDDGVAQNDRFLIVRVALIGQKKYRRDTKLNTL
jgi:hypothetical protein